MPAKSTNENGQNPLHELPLAGQESLEQVAMGEEWTAQPSMSDGWWWWLW